MTHTDRADMTDTQDTNQTETEMTKLTSKTALEYVTRIESLKSQISEVYREVCDKHGASEINLIRDLVNAREAAADTRLEADGLLASIDAEDEI